MESWPFQRPFDPIYCLILVQLPSYCKIMLLIISLPLYSLFQTLILTYVQGIHLFRFFLASK